ncbi:MAG TPA: RNase H family protein [Pyrinomonadaceae bacterium]|jgi:ribonuclease HI
MDQPYKELNEEEIDEIVTVEADDDAAWEKSIRVRKAKGAKGLLAFEYAGRVAAFARLRHEKGLKKEVVTANKKSAAPGLKQVTIVCDGSSLGNGQKASRAAAVALLGYQGLWRAVGAYLGCATNQQAEVAAAALGLESLRQPCRVHLFTDSRYVVETMSGRFRRKTNHEWWARLDHAAARHEVRWEWTRGHDGNLVQEAADKAARKIAASGRVDEDILQAAIDKVGGVLNATQVEIN